MATKYKAGMKFGSLTLIQQLGQYPSGKWRARCDCGEDHEASAHDMKRGKVQSCGCLMLGDLIDMTGQKFGRLLVIRHEQGGKCECRCDCGATRSFSRIALRRGQTSCGCAPRMDLTGLRFGRLVAIRYQRKKGWECKCDCGAVKFVSYTGLRRGETRSCGCLARDVKRERFIAMNAAKAAQRAARLGAAK